MKVEQLMTKDVRCCSRSDSANDAARVMWEHDCGFVPVVEPDGSGRVAGVVTDRDLCIAAYTQGRPLRDIPLDWIMSTRVFTCQAGDSLATAEGKMREGQLRRLVVVDAAGHAVGVLSLSDLARAARTRKGITWTEVAETLASISEQRKAAASPGAGRRLSRGARAARPAPRTTP
jgi:CBS domain-containing protein